MMTTCGVLVMDGPRLLLGHASRSPRWDIPKGVAGADEAFVDAASRELAEETGLVALADDLVDLGKHVYLPGKNLALFAWTPSVMPDPADLVCRSMVERAGSAPYPELDRFGLFPWEKALSLVGRNMAQVLAEVGRTLVGTR